MKSILKKVLKKLFVTSGIFLANKGIKFIYYHDIVLSNGYSYQKINVNKFKSHMEYLVNNGYKTLTFDELDNDEIYTYKNKEKKVVIMFDDGWLSNYNIVFPIMKKLNLKFNIFLEVGAINKKDNYLTWDMIREMKDSGLVGFGAHTFNHIDARLIDESNVDVEIYKSNNIIFTETGINVKDFCFPYGYYDKRILNYLKKLDVYKRIYTSDGRKVTKYGNLYIIGRIGIENEDTLKEFKYKLEGRYNNFYYFIHSIKRLLGGN